jgi:hypothetical protein
VACASWAGARELRYRPAPASASRRSGSHRRQRHHPNRAHVQASERRDPATRPGGDPASDHDRPPQPRLRGSGDHRRVHRPRAPAGKRSRGHSQFAALATDPQETTSTDGVKRPMDSRRSDRPRNRPRPAESRTTKPSNACLPDRRKSLHQRATLGIRARVGTRPVCSVCVLLMHRATCAAFSSSILSRNSMYLSTMPANLSAPTSSGARRSGPAQEIAPTVPASSVVGRRITPCSSASAGVSRACVRSRSVVADAEEVQSMLAAHS